MSAIHRARSAGTSLSLCGCATALTLFAGCFAAPSAVPSPSTARTATDGVNSQALDLDPAGSVGIAEIPGVPTGEQRLGEVDFRIGDSAMRVGSRSFPEFPRNASGVRVGRTFRVAHFLQATNGGGFQQPGHPKHENDGALIGEYVIRYEDGSAERIPLRYGHEVRDFWNWDNSLPTTNSEVVWNGESPEAAKYGKKVRLYKASWLNPHPEKPVATIDLISANAKAAPVCFAITVDDDPTIAAPVYDAPAAPPSAAPIAPPPIEIASAPQVVNLPASPAAAAASAPSQPTPEAREEPGIQAPPEVPPAAPIGTQTPTAAEPPASAEALSPSETKPTFNVFGAPENEGEPVEAAEDEPLDFLGPPPKVWEVVVDPPAAVPSYAEVLPYERLDGIPPRRIVIPATPSPYLAIEKGASDIEGFRVFDLRSGETTASVGGMTLSKSAEAPFETALSPDGKLTAVFDFSSESIYVGDLHKRKTQSRFPWKGSQPALLFAKADTLVAIETSQTPRVEVWRLPLGEQVAAFEPAGHPELNPPLVALSPGGRFLVLSVSGTPPEAASFYDLTTGKEAGTLALKGKIVDAYFLAFGFSADGREFAGYMNGIENEGQPAGVHPAVVVWDVETGRPTYRSAYEYNGFDAALHSGDRPLQWFPDGEGWLLSQLHVFDRKSGRIIRSLTEHMEAGLQTTGAQVLDDRRLFISDATSDGMEILEVDRSAPAGDGR